MAHGDMHFFQYDLNNIGSVNICETCDKKYEITYKTIAILEFLLTFIAIHIRIGITTSSSKSSHYQEYHHWHHLVEYLLFFSSCLRSFTSR